jgi:hypothetical protein
LVLIFDSSEMQNVMGCRALSVAVVAVDVSLISTQTFRALPSSIVVVFEVITGAEI